jgi:hypothetical protein
VWVWGLQAYKKDNFQHGYIRKPTQLPGGKEFQAIAADSTLGAALDSSGAVWVWENYSSSSLGNGNEGKLLPFQVPNISNVVSFTVGSAVDDNGSAWQWIFDEGKFRQISALQMPRIRQRQSQRAAAISMCSCVTAVSIRQGIINSGKQVKAYSI